MLHDLSPCDALNLCIYIMYSSLPLWAVLWERRESRSLTSKLFPFQSAAQSDTEKPDLTCSYGAFQRDLSLYEDNHTTLLKLFGFKSPIIQGKRPERAIAVPFPKPSHTHTHAHNCVKTIWAFANAQIIDNALSQLLPAYGLSPLLSVPLYGSRREWVKCVGNIVFI